MFKFSNICLLFIALNTSGCGKFYSGDLSDVVGEAIPVAPKPFGTCDRKSVATINLCMEALGSDYNEPGYLEILKSSCATSGGVFSTGTCEVTDSFGTCIVGAGDTNMARISYYPPQYTAASAQAACEGTTGGVYERLTSKSVGP